MKRFFKIAIKIFFGLLVLVILFFLVSYWNISTDWKKYYTEDEIKSYVSKIENSPKLTNIFYSICDKLHNNDRHKSITSVYLSVIWNELIMHNHRDQESWFVRAAYYFPKKNNMRGYPEFRLSWGLEKFTTPEKCFDYVMTIRNEQLIRKDSTFKNITQLKDTTEILEYIVRSKSPLIYKRRQEILNQKIAELRVKLK